MSTQAYVEDFIAISQVKAQYCRFLDTKDWAAYESLFTEDLELDVPGGAPAIRGRAAAIKSIRSAVEHAKTAHQVHQAEMQIDGDVANVTWAMQDRVIWGPDRTSMPEAGHTGYGHYRERYVRLSGRWQIAALKLTYLVYDSQPRI